ncbi:MAG: cation-transporting P-type ATPase [Alphaproteobacteria bacterium]|nr:MAG: cation-transporting P-type ATPase [Alphaproteobacteria bacterium]
MPGGAPPRALPRLSWHSLDAQAVLRALKSDAHGLTEAQARQRLAVFGPNRLPEAARRSVLKRLAAQIHNILIYVLLFATALSIVLGQLVDAGVILAVVVVNAAIGFIQEGRAERALDAIRGMLTARATVLRDGERRSIAAEDIVPGDIVVLEAGDRVAADMRLLRARNLRIEEAVLTGESVAVEKTTAAVAADAVLGDRRSMAFSGTLVAAGQGAGIVTATGPASELGRIGALIGGVAALKTPLIRQMDAFARHLTLFILAIAALAFVVAFEGRGYALADAFMAVVGLAVAAIPEGLPAIMTITLAIGVQRMAMRHAIIRRLPAVETLGAVSVICSDKTGTLTRNEMMVQSLVTAARSYAISGTGYAPDGAFHVDGQPALAAGDATLMALARAALLCNDAALRQVDGEWHVAGDPMEGALVTLAAKAGLDPVLTRRQLPRTDEIPFDAAHRFMATLHHSHEDGGFILIKGAPERVLAMCAAEQADAGPRPLDAGAWQRRAEALGAEGKRVLAFAIKPVAADKRDLVFADVESDAVLLGLAGFIDPPRPEAVAAVGDCRRAGIRIVMITGDHAATAREIARQLGLAAAPKTLTGHDVEVLDAGQLRQAVRNTVVFARTTPEHKLRLVEALQANGAIVAMTGDGVNDAPALKRADIGVAMGGKGTEAARQAADMVLADDNFASIVAAVREGRTVYDNLMKVIGWTLPTSFGEAGTIIVAIALALALPITPVQILWVNMITAVALGLTLAFEPTEPGTMRQPPRDPHKPILSRDLVWRIAFVSALFAVGAFGMFYWAQARGLAIETARTLVVNTLVVMEIFYLFSVRYVHGTSLTWQGLLGTRAVLVGVGVVALGQCAFTYLPVMQDIFETRAVALWDGLAIVGVGVALLVIVEIEKSLRRLLTARRPAAGATPPRAAPAPDRRRPTSSRGRP